MSTTSQSIIIKEGNFPFGSFTDFKESCRNGNCHPIVNQKIVQQWMDGFWDIKPPPLVRLKHILVSQACILLWLLLTVYIVGTRNWFSLWAIPLAILTRIALDPTYSKSNQTIRSLIMVVLVSLLCWCFISSDFSRGLIVAVLLIDWFCYQIDKKVDFESFFSEIFSNEEFCHTAWEHDAFALHMRTGEEDVYCSRSIIGSEPPVVASTVLAAAQLLEDDRVEVSIESNSQRAISNNQHGEAIELDAEQNRVIDEKAIKLVIDHEKSFGRTVEDVSMYYVGYDLKSSADGITRAIEVKGKASSGSVLVTANEWNTAKTLGNSYFLYVVEYVVSKNPRIKIIKNPQIKFQPETNKMQYLLRQSTYLSRAQLVSLRD